MAAVPTAQHGIAGLGSYQPRPGGANTAAQANAQNLGRNGVDEATGRPLQAVYPATYDATWTEGQIGDWVRHFRPDLLS